MVKYKTCWPFYECRRCKAELLLQISKIFILVIVKHWNLCYYFHRKALLFNVVWTLTLYTIMVDKGCFSFCFYIYSHGRGIIIQQMALEHCRHLRHVFYAFMCRYSCSPRREPSICRIIATSMTFGQNKKWSFFVSMLKIAAENMRKSWYSVAIFLWAVFETALYPRFRDSEIYSYLKSI